MASLPVVKSAQFAKKNAIKKDSGAQNAKKIGCLAGGYFQRDYQVTLHFHILPFKFQHKTLIY